MRHESILRQIALVSYGTKFLRKEIALKDWYRHGIFFDARLQFRRLTDNALLADDFTLWLTILRQAGAVRLSLHVAAELGMKLPRAWRGADYCIVAHYADHYDVWMVGEEWPGWLQHPLLSAAEDMRFSLPDSTVYASALDSYWRMGAQQGSLNVQNTDWRQLVSVIAADLDIDIPSSHIAAGPMIVTASESQPGGNLPLFPMSRFSSNAHALLATLVWEDDRLSNDRNPKNENSEYARLSPEGAREADEWEERLNGWMIEVQLRCANEYRKSDLIDKNSPFTRIHAPEIMQFDAEGVSRSDQDESAVASSIMVSTQKKQATKSVGCLALISFFLLIAIFVVLIPCIVKLAGIPPWIAVIPATICAIYSIYKAK